MQETVPVTVQLRTVFLGSLHICETLSLAQPETSVSHCLRIMQDLPIQTFQMLMGDHQLEQPNPIESCRAETWCLHKLSGACALHDHRYAVLLQRLE